MINQDKPIAVIKTYSFTMEHIAKVSDMAQRLNMPASEVLRNAIDAYYERFQPKAIADR